MRGDVVGIDRQAEARFHGAVFLPEALDLDTVSVQMIELPEPGEGDVGGPRRRE